MRKVYMNNAATTWPKPQEVPDAVYAFMTRDGANASRGSASERDIKSLDILFTARMKAASLFGGYAKANPKYVTLTSSVTHSLNVVIKGFVKSGMRVVTTSMEHNSVVRPLRELQRNGVAVEVIQASLRGYVDPKKFSEAALERTDLAVVSHCSNVCGSVQPIEEIAEICAKRGIPLVVDCAQTGGVLPINASELGLAALCFTGHKGLFGPQGTGGIVWKPEFADACSPFIVGGTGSLSHEETQPDVMPDKFEAGTMNLPGFAGLDAALDWIDRTGIDAIREREEKLGARLEEGLLSIKGLRLLGSTHGEAPRLPVYAFNVDGKDNGEFANDLSMTYGIEGRPGLHCSPLAHRTLGTFPEGALRLSPGYYTTEDEIDYTIESIRALASK
ncbi:aminotransferase class V-fold PLP-dependent enzyme [uncultured Cloacibacillus sp.]|uniref:aminotransferase class V-fold PLP-dependent enzyme n=1 Tax=uncultured Cloacibacillus sp. TaxID=889794 RepID=UPI0025E40031|nr:aminotransferase class V-fold PLP-dependent enzyme [uncultured Cloacibacillus sp.]